MERENYIEKLKDLTIDDDAATKKEKLPSLAIDTDIDKGTQTSCGYWIDETLLPARHRNSVPSSLDTSDHTKKQVSLTGCVDIRRRDLIPDGRGGYFVHITSKEIERKPRHQDSQRYDNGYRPMRNMRPMRTNPMSRSQPPPYQQNRPYRTGNQSRFGEHSRGMPPPPSYNHQLPMGGNNMAEDLIWMQQMQQPPQQNWRRNNNFLPYQ